MQRRGESECPGSAATLLSWPFDPNCGPDISKAILTLGNQMEAFKQCWKRQGNEGRTDQKDA